MVDCCSRGVRGEDQRRGQRADALRQRKFTFLPLPNPGEKWGTEPDQLLEATTPEVAFTLFDQRAVPDCFSAEGAALVRLRHLPSGRVYNVVFSSTQADYPEESEFHAAERGAQFAQIQKLIREDLDPLADREQRERVLLMGDLNVSVLTTGTAEWTQLFDTPASFFTKPLYDAWARTTSPQDGASQRAREGASRLRRRVSPPPTSAEAWRGPCACST